MHNVEIRSCFEPEAVRCRHRTRERVGDDQLAAGRVIFRDHLDAIGVGPINGSGQLEKLTGVCCDPDTELASAGDSLHRCPQHCDDSLRRNLVDGGQVRAAAEQVPGVVGKCGIGMIGSRLGQGST